MAAVIGGNRIEEVGGTDRITLRICREVFAGRTFATDERDADYTAELEY